MNVSPKKTSLRGLRIFCVAAKYCNYRLAAEELSVTASAVSHQVKSLEDELGIELFIRESRTLRLTDQGERLYRELEPAIAGIDEKIAAVVSSVAARQLRVSVQPFFASECFVPRLEEFTEMHPEIEIFVDTSDETAERHPASADAACAAALALSQEADVSRDIAVAQSNLGVVKAVKGDLSGARLAFSRALELKPDLRHASKYLQLLRGGAASDA